MKTPGLRLRQIRESLGLTYRNVEKASYLIALNRGRSDFILHISRLADIENRGVVPSLHKLYSLATILHLDPMDISSWYDAPFLQTAHDSAAFPPPRTHLSVSSLPTFFSSAPENQLASDDTELLQRLPTSTMPLPLPGFNRAQYRYGCVGLSDRRMTPMLRPGSPVLIDTTVHRIKDAEWSNEYDRPI